LWNDNGNQPGRCQRFSFCKIKESDIIKRLQWLAVKESLAVDEEAFSIIASRADGSLRDAEVMLDQLSLLDTTISSDMVRELVSQEALYSSNSAMQNKCS
jgi:DNA polymerase III gamma/tau subunit